MGRWSSQSAIWNIALLPSLAIGAAMLAPPAESAPAAPRCAVPRFEVAAQRDSFEPVLTAAREARLKASFLRTFASAYRAECARRTVSAANFRGIRKVVLIDADGNSDGSFLPRDLSSELTFELFWGDSLNTPNVAVRRALRCLARPTDDCFLD
jgi:hypothetical protein